MKWFLSLLYFILGCYICKVAKANGEKVQYVPLNFSGFDVKNNIKGKTPVNYKHLRTVQ